MFHWQNIVVALILIATGIYITRRVWSRLQSLVRTDASVESCGGGGCAGCGSPTATAKPPRSSIASKGQRSTLKLID
jgi:hypothetical protein